MAASARCTFPQRPRVQAPDPLDFLTVTAMPPKKNGTANRAKATSTPNQRQPTRNQRRAARLNRNAAATVVRMRERGDRHAISEVIVEVREGGAAGVFRLAPSRVKGEGPRTEFDVRTTLGQQALLYNRMQEITPIKVEWLPISTQCDGLVAMEFTTSAVTQWREVTDAVNAPEARRGPANKKLTMSVPLGRLADRGAPHPIEEPQGHIQWMVKLSHRTDIDYGNLPIGVIRITLAVMLTEQQAASALADMFGELVQTKDMPRAPQASGRSTAIRRSNSTGLDAASA